MATTSPPLPQFVEHRVKRNGGSVYVRDFAGTGPAFVLLHGFPDDSHIYDLLIPRLVSAGRRVVAVDFLGFGGSDKLVGAQYSFPQQLGDLEAVVEALAIEQIIPVGHDAGGPAAINFSLKHPDLTSAVVVMNAFYGDAPGLRVPELIELFANRNLRKLATHFLQSPQQFAWLIDFQRNLLQHGLTDEQKVNYFEFLGPVIDNNFRQQPSAAVAFAQMTSQLHEEVAANTARIVDLRRSAVPLHLVWGNADPYLHLSVAQNIQSQAKNASLHALDAGHWPQIDAADEVAQIMLGVR
ncbi:alpha/beta hydrolase [Caballeronia sp. GAWG1-1]|uniref:alpha/beta fold hydrolase n=1 Tax=Caballeronia sp. GAWG1-1 TaxID=2921742 RepID=UPI0020291CF1|nr:alpha/beta hydrolase [Caballeronia sp. GAWG1-1]